MLINYSCAPCLNMSLGETLHYCTFCIIESGCHGVVSNIDGCIASMVMQYIQISIVELEGARGDIIL